MRCCRLQRVHILATQKLSKGFFAQRAPQVSLCETHHGSSRGTVQAGLESEFRAKTLSQKDTAAHDCDPVFIEVPGHSEV